MKNKTEEIIKCDTKLQAELEVKLNQFGDKLREIRLVMNSIERSCGHETLATLLPQKLNLAFATDTIKKLNDFVVLSDRETP